MIRLENAKDRPGDLPALTALYERSFPANERRPLEPLLTDETGHAAVLCVVREGAFCGFLCLLRANGLAHIIYFAVPEALRGRGIGAEALAAVRAMYPGERVIVDIEQPDERAGEGDLRRRRMAFYLRCGYAETPVRYDWRGEKYVILSCGGNVTGEEFGQFWRSLSRDMPSARNY